MYKGLCVLNMKGGVGKTTVAVNMAWAATMKGHKTLLVDLDPQFNASVYLMRERPYVSHLSSGGLTVFDIFEEFSPMRDPQRPHPTASTVIYTGIRRPYGAKAALHLIPSQLELSATLKNPAGKAHLLGSWLAREAADYDLVIVDPPPTDSMATEAAYLASNYVLVPVKPEFLSTIGFPLLARSIANFRAQYTTHTLNVIGMVLENTNTTLPEYATTKLETQAFADDVVTYKNEKWPLLAPEIRFSRSYQRGSRSGTPIFDTRYAHWDVAHEFRQLADLVLSGMGM